MSDQLPVFITRALAALGAAVLVIGLLTGLPDLLSTKKEAVEESVPESRSPRHREEIGRQFRIRSGDPDSPVLSIQSAEIVKRKAGPFVLAAFNVLMIDHLQILFSPRDQNIDSLPGDLEAFFSPEKTDPTTENISAAATEPLFFLRSGGDLLKSLGSDRRASGIIIRPFYAAVREGEKEVPILRADQAEGRADGTLLFKNCFYLDENKTPRHADRAVLQLKDPVSLIADGQSILLRDVINAFGQAGKADSRPPSAPAAQPPE